MASAFATASSSLPVEILMPHLSGVSAAQSSGLLHPRISIHETIRPSVVLADWRETRSSESARDITTIVSSAMILGESMLREMYLVLITHPPSFSPETRPSAYGKR